MSMLLQECYLQHLRALPPQTLASPNESGFIPNHLSCMAQNCQFGHGLFLCLYFTLLLVSEFRIIQNCSFFGQIAVGFVMFCFPSPLGSNEMNCQLSKQQSLAYTCMAAKAQPLQKLGQQECPGASYKFVTSTVYGSTWVPLRSLVLQSLRSLSFIVVSSQLSLNHLGSDLDPNQSGF